MTLSLNFSKLGDVGAQYLANALAKNKVRSIYRHLAFYCTIHPSIILRQ